MAFGVGRSLDEPKQSGPTLFQCLAWRLLARQLPTHFSQCHRLPNQPDLRTRLLLRSSPMPGLRHRLAVQFEDQLRMAGLLHVAVHILMTRHAGVGANVEVFQIAHAGADAVFVTPIGARVRAEPILGGAVTAFTGNPFADARFLVQLTGPQGVEWRMTNRAPPALRRIADVQDSSDALRAGGFQRRVRPQVVKILRGPHRVLVPGVSRSAMATAGTAASRAEEFGRSGIGGRIVRPDGNRARET